MGIVKAILKRKKKENLLFNQFSYRGFPFAFHSGYIRTFGKNTRIDIGIRRKFRHINGSSLKICNADFYFSIRLNRQMVLKWIWTHLDRRVVKFGYSQ